MIDWWPGACDPQPDWRNPEIKGIAASEAELTAPLQMRLDLLYLILIWSHSEGTADQEKFTNTVTNTENSDAYIYFKQT